MAQNIAMLKPSSRKPSVGKLIHYYKDLFEEHITTSFFTLALFIGGFIGMVSNNWYGFPSGKAICAVAFAFGLCSFVVVFVRPLLEIVILPALSYIPKAIKSIYNALKSIKIVIPETNIIKTAVSCLLFIALLDMPYSYYQFMKIGVCVLFTYLAYLLKNNKHILMAIFSVFGAILFNPFSKFAIHKKEWQTIDLWLAIALLLWAGYGIFKETLSARDNPIVK